MYFLRDKVFKLQFDGQSDFKTIKLSLNQNMEQKDKLAKIYRDKICVE